MDNAMVKRGIGAVALAIIAALLLGYLLKDKSRERQEVVEMKLPGAPEINIPSLSETTDKITDSAASLVGEAKETVAKTGNVVVASASGTLKTLGDSASDGMAAVSDTVKSTVNETTTNVSNDTTNPGFSFRPPKQNEEQKITDNVASNDTTLNAVNDSKSNNTVVANTVLKAVKKFKPTIENESVVAKNNVRKAKKVAPVSSTTTSGGKYSIQLLATSSQSRANKLAKTMNGEGYTSFITQTTSNNKILYRVRVGGHNNRNSAIKAQETMKRRYQKNFFIQNSLVVSNN